MNVHEQIDAYINSQAEPKRNEMRTLHTQIVQALPGCKLWYEDGKSAEGKVVSNPNIGYGSYNIKYTDGTIREFFQIGLSANTTGYLSTSSAYRTKPIYHKLIALILAKPA